MASTTNTTKAPAEVIPRRVVNGALIGLGLLFVGLAAWRGTGVSIREPDARAVQQRELRFTDRADGGIEVRDAAGGQTLDVMHGEQGFLRGTLRGLARERKRRGLADAHGLELQLIARADGRLTLADAATGERIDLESFGPSNVAVYARWLGPTAAR
jgi:putative photosynthetic complex assembly protein